MGMDKLTLMISRKILQFYQVCHMTEVMTMLTTKSDRNSLEFALGHLSTNIETELRL